MGRVISQEFNGTGPLCLYPFGGVDLSAIAQIRQDQDKIKDVAVLVSGAGRSEISYVGFGA
jgi:hypothetical protein